MLCVRCCVIALRTWHRCGGVTKSACAACTPTLQDYMTELIVLSFLAFMGLYGASHAISYLLVPYYRRLSYAQQADWCTRYAVTAWHRHLATSNSTRHLCVQHNVDRTCTSHRPSRLPRRGVRRRRLARQPVPRLLYIRQGVQVRTTTRVGVLRVHASHVRVSWSRQLRVRGVLPVRCGGDCATLPHPCNPRPERNVHRAPLVRRCGVHDLCGTNPARNALRRRGDCSQLAHAQSTSTYLYFGMFRLMSELSTPFVSLHCLMTGGADQEPDAKTRRNWLYLLNGSILISVFFVVRVVAIPFYYHIAVAFWQQWQSPLWLKALFVLFSLVGDSLNAIWFVGIMKGAAKTARQVFCDDADGAVAETDTKKDV